MKRKIYKQLLNWRSSKERKPLIIGGARQVGKTYSVREFGQSYNSFIEINFITQPFYKQIFSEGYNVDAVVKQISFLNPNAKFIEGDTLIFFDELQEYPDCTTSLKFFKEDGRYDVICSGSMMGLNYKDTMRFVIIPQAIKAILPALGNEFIVLLKDTSLISVIGGKELLYAARSVAARNYEPMYPYVGAAIIYLLLVMLFTWLLGIFERRLRASDRR